MNSYILISSSMDQKYVLMRTHRLLIGLIALCSFCLPHLIEAKPFKVYQHVIVDQLGHGNFTTIQKAIDSVPINNRSWFFINVKAGLYKEKLKIPYDKPYIVIIGAGRRLTRVEWDDHESIVQSPTFATFADNTVVKAIAFVNIYNLPSKGERNKNPRAPAVAALVGGDKSAFYFVDFAGVQDTLWDFGGRHYFYRCSIQGAVDFIFGTGQSLYKGCVIQVLGNLLEPGQTGYITAQARSHPNDANGFVFVNCLVFGTGLAFLGRPWRGYARVIFYNSNLRTVVHPLGWNAMRFVGHENQLMFVELGCYGSGSNTERRVKWLKTKLSESTVQSLVGPDFINRDRWIENLPIFV